MKKNGNYDNASLKPMMENVEISDNLQIATWRWGVLVTSVLMHPQTP
jgi:hypothetical protein